MINGIKIEICAGSINDCLVAIKYPIDRIELNSAIELGGLTPSVQTLKYLKHLTDLPVCCMVRPRTAGFCYTDAEFDIMYMNAYNLLENGANGIVFGFLNHDNTINKGRTKMFVDLAHQYNAEAVFHKAFDKTNMEESIDILKNLGVDRVLTAGGNNIMEGLDVIKNIHNHGVEILPGGGVRINNIQEIIKKTNCNQIHMTSKKEYYDSDEMYYGIDEEQLKELLNKIENI